MDIQSSRDDTDIQKMPDMFQENGEPINPRLRKYIYEGEACEFNGELRAALKKYTGHDRVRNIAVIVIMLMIILEAVSLIFQSEELSAVPVVIIGILAIIISVFAYREFANGAALRAADRGEVRCFKYTYYAKLRYVIDPQDGSSLYFADLGDFMVGISSSTPAAPCAYGLTVNIKGSEHFYFLV
ncbi:MAG: hypothetical protein ACI4JF_06820 [Oscillospiraceae bacterium]